MATSYDLPQYIGELFQKSEKPNAVLRLVGGLTGELRLVGNAKFPMGVNYILPTAAQPAILEGAAPSPVEQDTAQADNIVQIFQKSVKLAYSKMGEKQSVDGIALIPGAGVGTPLQTGSLEWQLSKSMESIQRDANYSFLRGAYVSPANNSTARQTRGVRTAVTTNVTAVTPPLSKVTFEGHLRTMLNNSAFVQGDEVFVLGSAATLDILISLYEPSATVGFRPQDTREIVGVSLRTIHARWATCHLVWEPDVAANELFIFQPKFCRVTAMPIPQKGVLFAEPLGKVGAADEWQLYGELGIDYRDEIFHGVLTGITS
jgi:hypothetical protein